MTPRLYLRAVLPEALLVVACCVCLAMVALQGFVVDPALQFNAALLAGVSALLQAVLYAGAYRRGNLPFAAAGFLLAGGAVVAVGLLTSAGADPLADVEENHLALCAVLVVVNLLVFVLSRRTAGMLVLAAASLVTCALVEYLYAAGLVVPSVGLAACLAALLIVRGYARGVGGADAVERPAWLAAALTAVAAVLAALGIAALAWALVVAPLNPGHVELKLFTEYRSYETVEVDNPVETEYVEDPDLTTVTLGDEVVYGDIPKQIEGDDPALAELGDFIQDAREQAGTQEDYRFESDEDGVYLYALSTPSWRWLLLALVPAAVAAAAVLARLGLRRRARARIAAAGPREQVGLIYTQACRRLARLRRLGLARPASATPREFARDAAERMDAFTQGVEGTSWARLSEAYELAHYGGVDPGAEELAACWRLYDGLPGCVRRRVGRARYCLRYFWLV